MSTKTWTSDADFNTGTLSQIETATDKLILSQQGLWTIGGDVNVGRWDLTGGGVQNATFTTGGQNAATGFTLTEEYGGTSWCSSGDLSIAKAGQPGGCGTVSAGLCAGGTAFGDGTYYASTEEYDGTSWSSGGDLNKERGHTPGVGTQTAAILIAGNYRSGGVVPVASTVHYDGTSWSTGGDVLLTRNAIGGLGSETSALAVCGNVSPGIASDQCEQYDGTSWSSAGDSSVARLRVGCCGTVNAALNFGGEEITSSVLSTLTEEYNGTAWSTSNNLTGSPNGGLGGSGTQSAGLAWAGYTGSFPVTTQEYGYSYFKNGTWSVDFDSGSATTGWGNLSWTDIGVAGAWSTGGNLNRQVWGNGGCGTQTATLTFGGYNSSPAADPNFWRRWSEEYDGTSWYSTGDLNQQIYWVTGAGTQVAGLSFAGSTPYTGKTEEYNGTAWSTANPLNTARYGTAGGGSQTAAFCAGGYVPPNTVVTEEYDGVSWSSGGDMLIEAREFAGCGTQIAGLAFGGRNDSDNPTAVTQEYDGSSWSSAGDLGTARRAPGGCGTQYAGLSFGGIVGTTEQTVTEQYDGTNWSTGGNLNWKRTTTGAGTQSAGISFGGNDGGPKNYTEEYNGVGSVKARIKSAGTQGALASANFYPRSQTGGGAWSAGGNLNQPKSHAQMGAGTQTAGLCAGGYLPGAGAKTEEYNGTAWTTVNDINTARYYHATGGTQTSAFICGTEANGTSTETYDGTSWCTGGNLNTGNQAQVGVGNAIAGLCAGGYVGAADSKIAETYDGTSWTAIDDCLVVRRAPGASGTQVAVIVMGGGYIGVTATSESYDGTNWSTEGDLVAERGFTSSAGNGSVTAGFVFAGRDDSAWPKEVATAEFFNGTIWTASNSLSTARFGAGGCGTQTNALCFGGYADTVGMLNPGTTEESSPGWESTFYVEQPQDVECPDGRWCRLELTLIRGSTPEVTEINQNYGEDC